MESLIIIDEYERRRYVWNGEYQNFEYYMRYFKPGVLRSLRQFLSDYAEAALVILALIDCAGRGGWSADNRTSFWFPRIEGKDPIDVWRVIEDMRKFMADTRGNMAYLEAFGKYFEQPRLYRSDNEDGLVEEGFRTSVSQYPIYERIGKRKDVGDVKQLVEGVLWKWFAGRFKSEAATWQRLDECGRHYVLRRAADRWSYDEKWLLRCAQATGEKTEKRQWQSACWMLPPSCPENEALVDGLVELGRAAQAARDKLEDEKEAAKELVYIEERCAEEMERIGYGPPAVLAPRVLTLDERHAIKQACVASLSQADQQTQSVVATIDEFVSFCALLRRPENYILVPGGQYVEKQINTRTEQDMVNEMARELIELPRFSAYAKVHEERDGVQTVWKGRVQTIKLASVEHAEEARLRNGAIIARTSQPYLKKRTEIEEEIRLRQERWRGVGERGKPSQGIEAETGRIAAVAPETSEPEQPPPSHSPL